MQNFISFLKLGLIIPKNKKMLKKEYQILQPFASKPWKQYTFQEIKEHSGKSSDSYVYNTLKSFYEEGILSRKEVGNNILYSLTHSQKARVFASMAAEYTAWSQKNIPYSNLEKIAEKIPTEFFIMIVTGSYSKNTQTKNSDLDLVIICDDPKKVKAETRQEAETSIPPVHLHAFNRDEFLKMLSRREENFGKEVVRNNFIIKGAEAYQALLQEAIRNGFNG